MKIIFLIILIIIILFFFLDCKYENEYEYFNFIENNLNLQIKNITPELIIQSNNNITFIYLYTPNIYDYCKHSLLNIKNYIMMHNYGLIVYNEFFNDDVFPCWNKIAAILKNLTNSKYLVWIDADALINNFNIKIEHFINNNENKDLLICNDIFLESQCINSGVMIIKNSDWSRNFFKKVWENNFPHEHNDQNIIFYELVKEIYPLSDPFADYDSYCKILKHPNLLIFTQNAFNTNIQSYNQGDFIIHLMGVSTKNRIDIMRQINTNLGLDNYDKKNCLETINNYDKYDKYDKIDKIKEECLS